MKHSHLPVCEFAAEAECNTSANTNTYLRDERPCDIALEDYDTLWLYVLARRIPWYDEEV